MGAKDNHKYFLKKIAEYIVDNSIKGSFVECGVQNGYSAVVLAKTLQRTGFLFDTWHGFPSFGKEDAEDSKQIERMKKLKKKQNKNTFEFCVEKLKEEGVLNYCQFIRGDILKRVPEFVSQRRKEFSISMIHIDVDLYEPAKVALESLWEFVSSGGVVFFHDYGEHRWPGISKAVDEFADRKNIEIHVLNKEYLNAAVIEKGTCNISTYLASIRVEDV